MSVRPTYEELKQRVEELENDTERRASEEALRESQLKFRAFFNLSPQPIYLSEAETGRIIDVNDKLCELAGWAREEIVGLTTTEIGFYSPDDRARVMKELGEKGEVQGFEMDFTIKDGSVRKTLIFARVVHLEGGPFLISIMHDITAQRRLELQLQHAQKTEAMGTMAGGIAHEFNNILWIISGNTELAALNLPAENPAQKNLEWIERACTRGADLARQILRFSRQTGYEPRPLDIRPIVKESVKFLRSSIPTTIKIRQKITSRSGTILADPTQLHQVLINLCANASRAMQEKGGVLGVEVADIELGQEAMDLDQNLAPGKYVRLTISDTGSGMEPAVMERIFDPFFTTKGVGEGLGMGLAVAHGIVKSHSGVMIVRSELGKDTTFQVFFPMIETCTRDERERVKPVHTGEERILFVDDDEAIVEMGKDMLEALGYQVELRTDSTEALEVFRSAPDSFDLVITDMTMPHMTGEMLSRKLIEIRPEIPIILCTGHNELIDEDKAREIGIKKFIMKPVGMRNLAKAIRELLNRK